MTQTRNKFTNEPEEFLVKFFPPLLACNDPVHRERVAAMIVPGGADQNDDDIAKRDAYRKQAKIGAISKKFEAIYK